MTRHIEKLYDLTEELLNLVIQKPLNKNRESLINDINDLIDRREKCIKNIQPPYTENEVTIGQQIVQMDEEISQKMLHMQQSIRNEIKHMRKSKQSTTSYVNPYENVRTIDGMFLDQRK
ncbi:MAG TPA: hypothetical protein VK079_02020 [Bacillota bacterium]|nr:hypothetical protein [Bacillota bacterium]